MKMNNKGDYLLQKRRKMGLSSNEMARILNINKTIIEKWEMGICLPNISSMFNLAEVFNTTVDNVLSSDDLIG